MIISTGIFRTSGTTANVSMAITGDKGESGTMPLINCLNNSGVLFTSGSVCNFIISVPGSLGQLQYIRIWHDNSGVKPSWFLNQVVVRDVKSNRKWYFLSRQWLALDKCDGLIERVLYPATPKQLTGFKNLFYINTTTKLVNDHLWFSVVTKPYRSTFTRVQRLTCCFTLIYSALIANAMFYQLEGNSIYLELGPFLINVTEIIVGVQSSVIAVPINILIIFIFRNLQSKPKCASLEEKRTTPHEYSDKKRFSWGFDLFHKRKRNYKDISENNPSGMHSSIGSEKRATFFFPYWFRFFPYTLCFLICSASTVFLLFYSINWGKDKSNQWLVSITVSLVQDILITQPAKVIVLALLFSTIVRKIPEDTDTASAYSHQQHQESTGKRKHSQSTETLFYKPDKDELEDARTFGLKRNEMLRVFKETAVLFLYIFCLTVVCYGVRNSDRFMMTDTLKNVFKNTHKVIYILHHFNVLVDKT